MNCLEMGLLVRFVENQRFTVGQRKGPWALMVMLEFLSLSWKKFQPGWWSSSPCRVIRNVPIYSPSVQLGWFVSIYIELIIVFHLWPLRKGDERKVLKTKRNTHETKEVRARLDSFTWRWSPRQLSVAYHNWDVTAILASTPFWEIVI